MSVQLSFTVLSGGNTDGEVIPMDKDMLMDKDILSQYIDACELIKETEEDIRRVSGSVRLFYRTEFMGP